MMIMSNCVRIISSNNEYLRKAWYYHIYISNSELSLHCIRLLLYYFFLSIFLFIQSLLTITFIRRILSLLHNFSCYISLLYYIIFIKVPFLYYVITTYYLLPLFHVVTSKFCLILVFRSHSCVCVLHQREASAT